MGCLGAQNGAHMLHAIELRLYKSHCDYIWVAWVCVRPTKVRKFAYYLAIVLFTPKYGIYRTCKISLIDYIYLACLQAI